MTTTTAHSETTELSEHNATSRLEIRLDPTPKRIRVSFEGAVIADSLVAQLAYATAQHPQYLLPNGDIEWAGL